MRIRFGQQLLNYMGQPLIDGDVKVTLGLIACNALTAVIPGEALTGPEKIERVDLARRIFLNSNGADETQVSVEEVALLKRVINAAYAAPILVAAAWGALDPQ